MANARAVYEQMLEFFGEENLTEQMLIAFAQFEERQKEYERARIIYQYGLGKLGMVNFSIKIFLYNFFAFLIDQFDGIYSKI